MLYRTVPREATGLDVGVQVGFAPGRRATNATRTAVRRHLREAFRQHQGPLLEAFGDRPDCLTLMVLYRGRDETAGPDVRRDLPRALGQLAAREIPPPAPSDSTAP